MALEPIKLSETQVLDRATRHFATRPEYDYGAELARELIRLVLTKDNQLYEARRLLSCLLRDLDRAIATHAATTSAAPATPSTPIGEQVPPAIAGSPGVGL